MSFIAESNVEDLALDTFERLGYSVLHGGVIAPGELLAERDSYDETFLTGRLQYAVERLNPDLPAEAIDEALRKLNRLSLPSLVETNREFHRMLTDGVEMEIMGDGGRVKGERVRLIDWESPDANDWLAVNQFSVTEAGKKRRPDVVVFINGLPLAVLELKNAADENATVWQAYDQLQTYKQEIPSLFRSNELLIISDGLHARAGSLTAGKEWFTPWRSVDGDSLAPEWEPQLPYLLEGMFEKRRLLELIRHFIAFEERRSGIVKIVARYHQFFGARKAVESTVEASQPDGDGRGGVVWHTQGSGKSLTMAFFAGELILRPEMVNPTLVVLTDRNDLDDQLFGTFARCSHLLRQVPEQAESRADLRAKLQRASGGVIFTTIQKFFPDERGMEHPLLTDRSNVVVIADEAHRSQYGFNARLDPKTGKILYGFAQYLRDALPNATFVGFTATPIELGDKNTKAVFGNYVSIYDIQQAVEDEATVPIYYESRLAALNLDEDEKPRLDEEFEEVTEGEEVSHKEKLKTRWAALEAIVGTEKRLKLIAEDLVRHFEERKEAMQGKAMIVCMSRRICVELYDQIIKLRPQWHSEDDEKGQIKVVMTGSASDPPEWQQHIRNKQRRERIAERFKDPEDQFQIVLVRDMWLTGFDAPSLHTMYVDKPMHGHGLMQAIARVNRVFRDKPGGLVVDYLGLADSLRKAMAAYTEGGGKGRTAIDQSEAVAIMLEKLEICRDLFHGFDYMAVIQAPEAERLRGLPQALEHILSLEDGAERFTKTVVELSKAYALAMPRPEALEVRDEVAFFQAVKAALVKTRQPGPPDPRDLDGAIRQIVSKAIAPEGVIDIFQAAGLQKPDISILSDEFLAEVRGMKQRNLAVETLKKLLNDEIRTRKSRNVVESRRFSEMLENSINRYRNRAIETAQVIEELIRLAREMREAQERGQELGLSDSEVAFYDALASNESAVEVLGNDLLRDMARELAETIRKNASIDWTIRDSVRAKLRVAVKRLLKRHGYPPDQQEAATKLVIEQAELMAGEAA